jgi:hypothetical protein
MPLRLPDLDDLTWDDLTDEARSLIVSWAPEWTNHNPSDPGITLIELFAYLTEMLIYQTNRIGGRNVRQFLNLLGGVNTGNLDWDKLETVLDMHHIYRAVIAEDFEKLAIGPGLGLPSGERVMRAKCIPGRNLASESPSAQTDVAPSHVSLVVLSSEPSQPSKELLQAVRETLEPARLLTTQLHVVGPRYLTVKMRITLVPFAGTVANDLRKQAIKALEGFFDPYKGGVDKKGWPLGKNVYVSEVYQLLDDLPGVDYVTRTKHPQTGENLDELMVEPGETARLKRNKLGELEAVTVFPNELIKIHIGHHDLSIAPA